MAEATEEKIGWQVTDPDGNVVQSGEVSVAQMTTELAEMLGLATKESDG